MSRPFSRTGLHIDLRVQVVPMRTLLRLAGRMADQGHNTLVMEWEGSFPFQKHAIISNQYAYTRKEIETFVQDCGRWGLDVIPLQQCFGHLEYILQHKRYAHLRESQTELSQLCPCRLDEAIKVFSEIFREVADLHPSGCFHIGGDETYLLGHCPTCCARAEEVGKSRLYVDYFQRAAAEIVKLGKRPLLWVDMLLKYPEAASGMPENSIFIDWNYGWPVNRFGDFARLRDLPFEFWGAPAMRSGPDNHSNFSWRGHFENLRDYIPVARQMNFQGMILTSWSTSGIYGYEWGSHEEVVALHPIRRVYPHAGLPILSAAFGDAVKSDAAWDMPNFVRNYARENFGFDDAGAGKFFRALMSGSFSPQPDSDLPAALKNARAAKRIFSQLEPVKGQSEFAHYRLMADLLEHHLRFAILEEMIQSRDFVSAGIPAACRKLARLLEEAENLSQRFAELNAQDLRPAELREEIEYRMKGIRALHARMQRNGGKSHRLNLF